MNCIPLPCVSSATQQTLLGEIGGENEGERGRDGERERESEREREIKRERGRKRKRERETQQQW